MASIQKSTSGRERRESYAKDAKNTLNKFRKNQSILN
jgi:hypothetical protein